MLKMTVLNTLVTMTMSITSDVEKSKKLAYRIYICSGVNFLSHTSQW